MKKLLITCLCLGFHAFSTSHLSQIPKPTATPKSDDTDAITVSTNLVEVDVVVTDKKNRPVKDLKRSDFEIFESGKKQGITSFSFISANPGARSRAAPDDSLGLGDNRNGTSLKEKIAIPTIAKRVRPGDVRRTLVIVVDDIGLSFPSVRVVKNSLKKFIREQIRPGDLATLVTTSGSRVFPGFTSDKKKLLALVKKVKWAPKSRGGADYYDPIKPSLLEELSSESPDLRGQRDQEKALLEDIEQDRKNASAIGTLGSLNYIVGSMRELPGRKAVVLFSEGFSLSNRSLRNSSNRDVDLSSETPKPSASNRFGSGTSGALKRLIDTANRSSVVIYPIDPRGLQFTGMAYADEDIRKAFDDDFRPGQTDNDRTNRYEGFRQTQDGLRVLAAETGGFATINQNNLGNGLRRIIEDQSYYLLSYITDLESINSSSDVLEKVEIRVKNPDMKVRYRSAFYSERGRRRASGLPETPRAKVGYALAYPFKANEIDLNLYSIVGNYEYGNFVRFLVNIATNDLKFERDSKGMRKANFDLLAITLNEKGKPVHQFAKNFSFSVNEPTYRNISRKGFVYDLPVILKKSGVYHFRVAIHDSKTGRVGAAGKFLETPRFEKKRLWISNLTLKRSQNDKSKSGSEKNEKGMFTDTTLRRFAVPLALNYGAVIYNPKIKGGNNTDLAIRTRLIRDRKVILETPFEPVSTKDQKDLNRIDLSGRIRLQKNLLPGNYIFQIIVMDKLAKKKAQIATQWIDFEILRK